MRVLACLTFALVTFAVPASAQPFRGQHPIFGRSYGAFDQGRWCAQERVGSGVVEENCHYDSFEACRRQVIQGNRGFCTQNPHYAGPPPRVFRSKPVRRAKRR